MSGIESVPMPSYVKGYDYAAGSWKSIAVNRSGEVGLRRGEIIDSQRTILVTANSGGNALGSGLTTSGFVVDRVTLSIPRGSKSGAIDYSYFWLSGRTDYGIWVGGCSGDAPYRPAAGGFVGSGRGLFLGPGQIKDFYVDRLDQIYVCAGTSGTPITYITECIVP
jgi:hypothetical protein